MLLRGRCVDMATNKNRQAPLPDLQPHAAQQAGQVFERIEGGRRDAVSLS